MKYELDRAYDIYKSRLEYTESSDVSYLAVQRKSSDNSKKHVKTAVGDSVHRYYTPCNTIVSFWYYTKNSEDLYSDYINSVNSNPIIVAGISIPKHKAVIREINHIHTKARLNGTGNILVKVSVSLELEVEKPVLTTTVKSKGYTFKHNSKLYRIQFSSTPEVYLSDSRKYPNAFTVGSGYGFYSENRPDLNIREPMFLTSSGEIAFNENDAEDIVFIDRTVMDWEAVCLPSKIGACL